ncbi:NUC185 domain-containing protein [Coprinopsis sp. MPI-PUGE-AT-0042]|nr:NUC185 domain-containing protein [Coprinopsis sp. MPI-PUGE-AT-0042]
MTTEILRSMLYKGADLIRESMPNAKEFADWVGRTKKKDIYVISTPQRPVPLEHYLYAGRDMFKIVDAKRNFLALVREFLSLYSYKEAGESVKRKQDKERQAAGLPPVQRQGAKAATSTAQRGGRGGARGGPPAGRGGRGGGAPSAPRTMHTGADKNLYVHLVGHLKKKSLLPVVVFTLSKKRCEENAATLTNQDLCSSVEKSEVHVAVEKALSRLKGSDKKLPQITRMRDYLTRGIGIHHGGLLPLVKETPKLVEILFARGLVKILFATETFAMGVNMPAKCVVFSSIRKHDGKSFRDILPGEYTQMAGRAGRRGLDPTGTVIIVSGDNLPEQTALHTMIIGVPGKLSSQFRLTYNMILNLLRVEALRVEEMIKRSFSENASQRLLPTHEKEVIKCDVCAQDIDEYYDYCFDVAKKNQILLQLAISKPQGAKLLSSGRVVVVRDGHFSSAALAILLKPAPVPATATGQLESVKSYFVLALVHPDTKAGKRDVDAHSLAPKWPIAPIDVQVQDGVYELKAVPVTSIVLVIDRTAKVDVTGIVDTHLIARMKEGIATLDTLLKEWAPTGSIPEVDWSKLRAFEFQETLNLRNTSAKRLDGYGCTLCSEFREHVSADLGAEGLEVHDENSTVLLKGRVACEINSASELILTELILENTFAGYEPEEVAALLSCFVFQEKTDIEPVIPPKLETGRDAILAISDRVERIQSLHKVAVEDFRNLKFGLVEVVYEWANGMPFEQITSLTDVPEGTIVRVITRLFKKMEDAQIKIKRDSLCIKYFTPIMQHMDTDSLYDYPSLFDFLDLFLASSGRPDRMNACVQPVNIRTAGIVKVLTKISSLIHSPSLICHGSPFAHGEHEIQNSRGLEMRHASQRRYSGLTPEETSLAWTTSKWFEKWARPRIKSYGLALVLGLHTHRCEEVYCNIHDPVASESFENWRGESSKRTRQNLGEAERIDRDAMLSLSWRLEGTSDAMDIESNSSSLSILPFAGSVVMMGMRKRIKDTAIIVHELMISDLEIGADASAAVCLLTGFGHERMSVKSDDPVLVMGQPRPQLEAAESTLVRCYRVL